MNTVSLALLKKSSSFRSGITLPSQKVTSTFAEIENIYNVSVPEDSIQPWKSASGGMHWDQEIATKSGIAESLERYSAAVGKFNIYTYDQIRDQSVVDPIDCSFFSESQYQSIEFPWKKPILDECEYGDMYSVYDNSKVWVMQELIGLGTKSSLSKIPSTSTGLAAHTNIRMGLLRAIQEILERDALICTWQNSLGGREVELPEYLLQKVKDREGEVLCFDITQDWNPHPVIIVCGYLLQRGKKRFSLGVACREDYQSAVDKAFLEWNQGCIFAGYFDVYHPDLKLSKKNDCTDFDLHAVYYTLNPGQWNNIPLIKYKHAYMSKNINYDRGDVIFEIKRLLTSLKNQNIKLYYRNISTTDVKQAGLFVVRAYSPTLSLLHGDERIPFLGGKLQDIKWRYGSETKVATEFPNPYPHPLG